MKFRLIPPGTFTMGNSDENPFVLAEDRPQHRVRLTKPYYLGAHEVTVGQFRAFVTATKTKTYAETDPRGAQIADEKGYYRVPGTHWPQTDNHPVACGTWAEANAFCEWLSKKEGMTARLRRQGSTQDRGHGVQDRDDQVTYIAPIRVFNALRVLDCGGTTTDNFNGHCRSYCWRE